MISIGLTDMFQDARIINVWFNIFIGTVIIPLADALPKYMKKLKSISSMLFFIFSIYFTIIGFSIILGYIKVIPREYRIPINKPISSYTNRTYNITINYNETEIADIDKIKTMTTLSNISYTLSLMKAITLLMLKNIYWFIRDRKRAIILKSPVLIQSLNQTTHNYKKKCHNKTYLQQEFKIDKHSANKITLSSHFPIFHTY